jgi:hypothetical protein
VMEPGRVRLERFGNRWLVHRGQKKLVET